MRIAYISADPGVPVFGRKGCSIHVQEVVRALYNRGIDIDLFTSRVSGDPPSDMEGIGVIRLPSPNNSDPARREQEALAANEDLRRLLQRHGPYDMVYERYSLWSMSGMEYAQDTGTPGVLEVNAPLIDEQAHYRTLVHPEDAQDVAERVFGAASALIAVSDEIASYIEGFPVASGRIHVVPNGVNQSRFSPKVRTPRPTTAQSFIVGFLGTLKPWHDLATLVEAFATLHRRDPSFRLSIVGDGPERASVVAALSACGEQVHRAATLTGAVSPQMVPTLLSSMNVAVAPYLALPKFYFSPLKVFEYMAMELPVVASRVGQLATLLEDEVDSLLVPPGDSAALVDQLYRLRQNPSLRRSLGRAARAKVLRLYTWDAVVERILGLVGLNEFVSSYRERSVS